MTDEYLTQVDPQEREKEAVRRFCATPFLLEELLVSLGIPGGFYWVLLEVPHGRLIKGRMGDIDLLAGPLAWSDPAALSPLILKNRETHPDAPEHLHRYCAALELAGRGGLLWPPPLDYLVAIEAKCAYFDVGRQRVMSQKASDSNVRDLRIQIDELLQTVPFNRVALLDLIVNPPVVGIDGHAWMASAGIAVNSLHQMLPTLRGRLPSDSPSGHFVMPWGAVEGGTEMSRGTGAPIQLRAAAENPRLGDGVIQERRRQLVSGLTRLLEEQPLPHSFPIVLGEAAESEGAERE